jgi:hypothetical protein
LPVTAAADSNFRSSRHSRVGRTGTACRLQIRNIFISLIDNTQYRRRRRAGPRNRPSPSVRPRRPVRLIGNGKGVALRFLGGVCGPLCDRCGSPESPRSDADEAPEVMAELAPVRDPEVRSTTPLGARLVAPPATHGAPSSAPGARPRRQALARRSWSPHQNDAPRVVQSPIEQPGPRGFGNGRGATSDRDLSRPACAPGENWPVAPKDDQGAIRARYVSP